MEKWKGQRVHGKLVEMLAKFYNYDTESFVGLNLPIVETLSNGEYRIRETESTALNSRSLMTLCTALHVS